MRKRLLTLAPEALLFLLLPLLLAAVWERALPPRAYVSMIAARGLLLPDGTLISAPLWTGLQAVARPLHLPLAGMMAFLSASGWGIVALYLYHLLRRPGGRTPALLLALLPLSSPLLPATLATAVPWQTAVSLWALAATVNRRWRQQAAALLLLPALICNWHSLLLAGLLLAWRWYRTRRLPGRLGATVAALFLTGMAGNQFFWGRLLSWPAINMADWQRAVAQLAAESEFYGLALLLAGAGLLLALVERRPLPLALLLWGEVALFDDPLLGAALIMLAALPGLQVMVDRLQALLQQRVRGVNQRTFILLTTVLVVLPILLAHGSSLWQRYRARPLPYLELLAEAGRWVRDEGAVETVVFGPAQAVYHAALPARPWSDAANPHWPDRLQTLIEDPPHYIITANTSSWSQLTHAGWFQERYRPVLRPAAPASPLSPVIVWSYSPGDFDQGAKQPAQVRAENGLKLVGYRYWPRVIEPGEAVYVTLDWEATQPLTRNVNTVVRLIAPVDQQGWAQRNMHTPRSLPPAWITPGDIFPERFVLTTTGDIPVGAYQLNLSLLTGRAEEFTALYQNEDTNPLDRVQLGYVTVPWRGELPPAAVSVQATFGDQIGLLGYTLEGAALPGSTLALTLYWEAQRLPDANYTIFVHLLDDAGQYITGHDAPPRDGSYPTRGWVPGYPLPDAHPIALPGDMAPGAYRLLVGLYLPGTGERLPVVDEAGNSQPDQTLLLRGIQVFGNQ